MNDINNFDIKAQLIESVLEIFDSMLSLEVEYSEIEPEEDSDENRLLVTIAFSGDVIGSLNIQVSAEFARVMTAAAQGAQVEDIEGEEEIQNLLAEIANMTAGNLKGALTDTGYACALSAPVIASGTEAETGLSRAEHYERLVFRHAEEIISVEAALAFELPSATVAENGADHPIEDPDKKQAQESLTAVEDFDLDLILDIPIELTVELGRKKIQIDELLQLGPGSAVPLAKLEGEPVDILANDTLIARGQVVVQDEKYGIKVTQITSRMDRIKSLS